MTESEWQILKFLLNCWQSWQKKSTEAEKCNIGQNEQLYYLMIFSPLNNIALCKFFYILSIISEITITRLCWGGFPLLELKKFPGRQKRGKKFTRKSQKIKFKILKMPVSFFQKESQLHEDFFWDFEFLKFVATFSGKKIVFYSFFRRILFRVNYGTFSV